MLPTLWHCIAGVGTFSEWLVLKVAPVSSGLSLDRSRWVSRSVCGFRLDGQVPELELLVSGV